MFTTLEALNSNQHANLRYKPNQPYHFAAKAMMVPIVSAEFRLISREYPIVFPKADPSNNQAMVPQALMGTQTGRNLHVKESGHWIGRYVPAHIRRYPFIAAPAKKEGQQSKDRTFAICIDTEAPHLSTTEGEPLYENGEPSPVLKKVQEVLTNLQKDFEATARLVQLLDDAGLLVDRHLEITRKNEKPVALTGFQVIDGEKLGNLSPDTLSTLHKSGAMMLVYAHLVSLTNLQDGLLAQAVSVTETEEKVPDIESLFGGDDDIFKFDA